MQHRMRTGTNSWRNRAWPHIPCRIGDHQVDQKVPAMWSIASHGCRSTGLARTTRQDQSRHQSSADWQSPETGAASLPHRRRQQTARQAVPATAFPPEQEGRQVGHNRYPSDSRQRAIQNQKSHPRYHTRAAPGMRITRPSARA